MPEKITIELRWHYLVSQLDQDNSGISWTNVLQYTSVEESDEFFSSIMETWWV